MSTAKRPGLASAVQFSLCSFCAVLLKLFAIVKNLQCSVASAQPITTVASDSVVKLFPYAPIAISLQIAMLLLCLLMRIAWFEQLYMIR